MLYGGLNVLALQSPCMLHAEVRHAAPLPREYN